MCIRSTPLLRGLAHRRLPAEATERTTSDRLLETWRANGERLLASAAENARARGVEVDSTVRADPTPRDSDLVVDEARRVGARSIVMETHGRGALLRLALGSDAEAVLRDSPVPVPLVRARSVDMTCEASRGA
jgi:nucleotide-binding universal stress UspA family protein